MVKLNITQKKDGRQVAWFRSTGGLRARVQSGKVSWVDANRRVGTSMRATTGEMSWTQARQMMELAQYGIQLMLDRTAKAIGSDDQPMAPLGFGKHKTRWSKSGQRLVQYGARQSYAGLKVRLGLEPIRDLRGPGGIVRTETKSGKKRYAYSGSLGEDTRVVGLKGTRGHMLDDIRVNYVDDYRATIDITTKASRVKARANEDRSPWWGWSPSDMRKLMARAAEIFPMGIAEKLYTLGLTGMYALTRGSGRWLNPIRRSGRRVA